MLFSYQGWNEETVCSVHSAAGCAAAADPPIDSQDSGWLHKEEIDSSKSRAEEGQQLPG